MKSETRLFLTKLAALMEEHQATLFYTIMDDGVHVALPDDRDVKIGYGGSDQIREILAKAK